MPLYPPVRKPLPAPAVGQYFASLSGAVSSTSNTLGVGTLRLAGNAPRVIVRRA